MELYGSLSNISGSVSASYFTGSYIGDGAGLYNLPASGVTGLNLSQIASGSVTASVNPSGFNVNTSTSITGSLNVSGTVLSQTTPLVSGSSQINITGTTGYSAFSSSIATTDSNQESRLSLIETSTGSLNSFTSSTNNRLIAVETSTGSLNSFSSSIDTTIKNKLNIDGVISGSSQILNGSNIVSSSAQVSAYGFATTGSNLFIGTQTHSGSILPSVDNAYDLGSATYQWRDVYISSGSLYIDGTKVIGSTAQELTITTDTGQSIKILEGTTDSIILQTADGDIELKSSADGDILLDPTNGKIMLKGPIEILNGQKIQSSVGGTPVVFANDIVVSGSIDITGTIEGINLTDFSSSLNTRLGTLETSTGSLNSFTSSTNSKLSSIETSTSSLNSYTSSNNTRLNTIESTTGSLNSYTSSTNTKLSSIETTTSSIINVNTTQNSRLDSLETTSGSILSTNTVQSSRLDSIEGKTGSYATTGSNIFQGTQTITGSLYISQDLVIAGSSSIQHITSSQLNIGDNIITVNAQNPSIRFGGLAVIDSGSNPQVSGSMLFDSVNNQWLFVHQNQGTVTSSVLLMGPETYNNLGNEAYITTNRLVKSTGIEHLTNSNISDDGTTVTILSNAVINGTFSATGTTIVSGSSQINHNSTTNYVANEHINHTSVSISAGNGLSGGGDISATRTLSLDTTSTTFTNGVKTKMNTEGVVSGSSQISFNGITDKPTLVSGSSQISFNGITDKPTLVSGSSQITYGSISGIPGGIVSGSAQVDLTNTTNYSSGIKTRLNAEGVLSGSAQVVASLPAGTVSGSSQITYGSISGIPSGIVSGSSQISFGSISGVPSGLVSGSSQISFGSISGVPSGLVSGSSQISFGSISGVPSGLVSGSSQIAFGSISGVPSGLVSGSSQISIASTSGFGTYIDQALLTTSTPTHSTLRLTGALSAWNTTTPATGTGGIHLGAASGTSNQGPAITFGARDASSGANAQAGIYINSDGSYGTRMYLATTDSYAAGSKTAVSISETGVVNFPRARPTYAGNTILDAANYTSYAMAGAGYSANQSLNTSNTVQFGSLGVGVSPALTVHFRGSNEMVRFENTSTSSNQYCQLNMRAGSRNGYIWIGNENTSSWAGAGGLNIYTENGNMDLWTNATQRIRIQTDGHMVPYANNSYDLGSSSLAWRNVYTNDLHLSNMNKPEGNDVDGTNGNWTIQEGAENLYIINNNNGKKYKISLEEI